MKRLLFIIVVAVFFLCIVPDLSVSIFIGDTTGSGRPDSFEEATEGCSLDCPEGYHCVIPEGTIIYTTTKKYGPDDFSTRYLADSICINENPDKDGFTNIHAFVSFKQRTDGNMSDFILYMPRRYFYDDFMPLYWYSRTDSKLTQFAGNWKDAFDGGIIKSNSEGTGNIDAYWTGSDYYGKYYWAEEGNKTCDGWKTTSKDFSGAVGNVSSISHNKWVSSGAVSCDKDLPILCAAEFKQGASFGMCVEKCEPTKTECGPKDCGVHSNGCGGKLLCGNPCGYKEVCRPATFNDPFAFDLTCQNCDRCNPGGKIESFDGDCLSFGVCRQSNWECREIGYNGCTDFYFTEFSDFPLTYTSTSDDGGTKTEISEVTVNSEGELEPNPLFDINGYVASLCPPNCQLTIGGTTFDYGKLTNGCKSPCKNPPPDPKTDSDPTNDDDTDYSWCKFPKGCWIGGAGGVDPCVNPLDSCEDKSAKPFEGCDYGCCTERSSTTGRDCPAYMNPGGDAGAHDTG